MPGPVSDEPPTRDDVVDLLVGGSSACPYVVGDTTKHCTLAARDADLVQQARRHVARYDQSPEDGFERRSIITTLLDLFREVPE